MTLATIYISLNLVDNIETVNLNLMTLGKVGHLIVISFTNTSLTKVWARSFGYHFVLGVDTFLKTEDQFACVY